MLEQEQRSPIGTGSAAASPRLIIMLTLDQFGGVATYVELLLPALVERFNVWVAAHGDGPLQESVVRAGATYVPLRHMRRPIRPFRDTLATLELVRLFRSIRPDVVHLNSAKAGVLGRLAAAATGVPVRVYTSHGWAFATHPGTSDRLYLWTERLVSRLTTTTICVSESELRRGVSARACIPATTVVIPNGIGEAVSANPGSDDGPCKIISVGRLHPPKDFSCLLEGLAQVRPGSYQAVIVGDGPDRSALERQAHDLHLRDVEFLGNRSDVEALLEQSSVFVLCSTSEAMPMSVLEAMASGLPVVASAVGGIPELVVDGETGVLVPSGDPAALADAIAMFAESPDARARFGAAGQRRARERFSVVRFRQAHLDLYRAELTRGGIPAAP
jgi:glycosyltransferase involved in cell wall biosynthesis